MWLIASGFHRKRFYIQYWNWWPFWRPVKNLCRLWWVIILHQILLSYLIRLLCRRAIFGRYVEGKIEAPKCGLLLSSNRYLRPILSANVTDKWCVSKHEKKKQFYVGCSRSTRWIQGYLSTGINYMLILRSALLTTSCLQAIYDKWSDLDCTKRPGWFYEGSLLNGKNRIAEAFSQLIGHPAYRGEQFESTNTI